MNKVRTFFPLTRLGTGNRGDHLGQVGVVGDRLRGDLAARVRRRPPQKRCEALVVGGVEERQLGEKALHHRHQVHALEVLKRRVGEKLVKRDRTLRFLISSLLFFISSSEHEVGF